MTEVTKSDDARVQVVYDILCTYVRPPSGEDLERFVARHIVAALAAPTSEVIAGALFDFLGYLTSLPAQEAVTFSECHEASSAVEHLEKWAEKRSLSLDEADLFGWHTTKADTTDALDAMRFRALFGAAIAEDETFIDAFNSIVPENDSKVTLDEIRTAIDASLAAQTTQGAKP